MEDVTAAAAYIALLLWVVTVVVTVAIEGVAW
jgi:hypothetical protein